MIKITPVSLCRRTPDFFRVVARSQTTFQAMYSESRPSEYEAPRLPFWAYAHTSVLRVRDLTTSRGACRAPRATVSRSRLPVGVRALTELGFVAVFQATSARS